MVQPYGKFVFSLCARAMQVVKRMAEQLPTSNPVRLLQSICQQVQAEAQTGSGGYPPMSEGYSRGPQEVFDSRGMASVPEDPFAGAASNMPPPSFGNEQMFTGAPLHCLVLILSIMCEL